MSRMMLVAVAVAAVVAVGVNALHEDEVGNRDWYQANIGDITHASFHPSSPGLKQVYVASKQGVVAAIPNSASSDGAIRWRHILSSKDKAECIVAHSDDIAHIVTTRGQVLLVSPGNGQILVSTSLKMPEYSFDNQLRVFGCAKAEGKNSVAVFASVATGESDTEIVRVVIGDDGKRVGSKVVATLSGAQSAIKSAAFSPNGENAWVITEESQLLFALSFAGGKLTAAKLPSIKASDIASVTDSNTAVVRVATASGKKVFKAITSTGADDKSIAIPTCSSKHCKYVLESGSVVGVSRASESSLDITTKAATVSVPNTGNWAPTILATTTVASSGKVILLLKSCNSDIQLVTVTEGQGEVAWTRLEGMASPAFVRIADQETIAGHEVRLRTKEDRFGFNQRVLMLSKFGTIYTFQTGPTAAPAVLVDVEGEVASALGKECVRFSLTFRRMSVESGNVAVVAYHEPTSSAVTVIVDAATGAVRKSETKVTTNAAMFYGPLIVDDNNQVHFHHLEKHWPHVGVHAVDMRQSKSGVLSGVTVGKDGQATQTWRMRFGERVVGHASGAQSPLNIMSAENLRVYTNTSKQTSVNEVRRKYPTANVLVVAHVETSRATSTKTLVITAIDIVSGSVLNVVRHKDAQGPIHIVIAEHAVIYHFYSTYSQRFMIGVWEMFEREDSLITDANMASPAQVISSIVVPSKIRSVSSASLRPPVVPSQVLLFPPGAITSLGVTNSYHGIARKQLVATTTAGNVYTVDIRTVLFGGQVNPQKPDAPPVSFVAVSPLNIISFGQPVMGATQIVTSPTSLESSSHVVVVGIDTFYMRVSSGKAWDLLNDDFNAPLLVVTLVAFAALTFVARYFANKKGLSAAWA